MDINRKISFAIIFFLIMSCGGNGQKIQKIPGDQEGNTENISPGENYFFLKNPGLDFSSVYAEVGVKSEDITFELSSGMVTNFTVDLDNISNLNGDWHINRLGNCSGDFSDKNICTVTITFSPKKIVNYNTTLIYSYINNKGKSIYNNVKILDKPNKSLLEIIPHQFSVPVNYLNKIQTGIFINSPQSFIGLYDNYLIKSENNSFYLINNKPSIIFSYGLVSFPNTIYYKDNSLFPFHLYSVTKNSTIDIKDSSLINLVANNKSTFVTDGNGIINLVNSNGTLKPFNNKNNYANEFIVADESDNKFIYGIFMNTNTSEKFLCSVNISSFAQVCSPSLNNNDIINTKKIFVYKDNIFLLTQQDSKLNVIGFMRNGESYVEYFRMQDDFVKAGYIYSPVYDPLEKILYILTYSTDNTKYTLTAIDTNNGNNFDYSFPNFEIISNPFLTSGVNKTQHSKVFLISNDQKIYAFERDNSKINFALKEFIFNSGLYYPMPKQSIYYPRTASINNGTVYIPSSISDNLYIYMFYTNW